MRLIDAKELERQAKEAFKENPVVMGIFLRWIRKQPTIEAELVRHGRWESKETECKTHLIYNCSECADCWGYGAMLNMNYCPNCGAKMDKEG